MPQLTGDVNSTTLVSFSNFLKSACRKRLRLFTSKIAEYNRFLQHEEIGTPFV